MVYTSRIPSGVLTPVRLKSAEITEAFPAITHVWGGGNAPDHNTKRCVDYMVINTTLPAAQWPTPAAQKALGDAVAEYHWKHRERLGLRLIIWRRRIRRNYDRPGIPAGAWVHYYGPNPHMDHPHIEYDASAYRSQYLGPYVVDEAKVSTVLLGHRGEDTPKERPAGYVIDTGVEVVTERDGRKWLLTEAGWAYDMAYLKLQATEVFS